MKLAFINMVRMSFCGLLLLVCSPLYAKQEWRIVLLADDLSGNLAEDPNENSTVNVTAQLLPRSQAKRSAVEISVNNHYQQAVEQAIVSQLLAANFEVLDKKLLTPGQTFTETSLSLLSEQQANLAIRYQLTVNRQITTTSPKWHYQLSLSLVDLISKNKIESYRTNFTFSGMPQVCNKNCQQQWLNQWAAQLARDAGAVIVEKLQHLPRRYHYRLSFVDFSILELSKIQKFISSQTEVVFSELIKNLPSQQQFFLPVSGRQYRYVSLLPADQLDVLFNQFFYIHELTVTKKHSEGTNFHFVRQPQLMWPWFLAAAIFVLVLTWCFIYLLMPKRAQKHLAQFNKISEQDFQQAADNLIKKLTLLKKQITYKQATAKQAGSQQGKVTRQSYVYQALSALDYFTVKFQPELKDVMLTEKLALIRQELIQSIPVITGAISANHFSIYQQASVEIGQLLPAVQLTPAQLQPIPALPAIILGYQNLMPAGLQTQLCYQDGHFYCFNHRSDQLLTYYNYQPLPAGVSQLIHHQAKIMLAADQQDAISPCQFICQLIDDNLLLRLDSALPELFDTQKISRLWPLWQQDLKKRWLLQQADIAITLDENGQLTLGEISLNRTTSAETLTNDEDRTTKHLLAWLSYHHGFHITPVIQEAGDVITTSVYINNTAIYQQVVLTQPCQIVIAGQVLKISELN
ncbi:MAG: hypothetical protein ACSHW0_02105 [Thalassotalea sp.]